MLKTEVCFKGDKINLALPVKLPHGKAKQACENIARDVMVPVRNESELTSFVKFMKNKIENPIQIWTPYSDQEKEGEFLNVNDMTNLTVDLWGQNQPNGKRDENCIVIAPSWVPKAFTDLPCSYRIVSGCRRHTESRLKLRGLCAETKLDRIYVPKNSDNFLMYSGWRFTTIR